MNVENFISASSLPDRKFLLDVFGYVFVFGFKIPIFLLMFLHLCAYRVVGWDSEAKRDI